jgi:hypothetical protein
MGANNSFMNDVYRGASFVSEELYLAILGAKHCMVCAFLS